MDNGLTFSTMFEEMPLTIRNSSLLSCYLSSLVAPGGGHRAMGPKHALALRGEPVIPPSYAALNLDSASHTHRNLEQLIDKLDEYKNEESNLAFMARQIAREKSRADAYMAKRKEENASRTVQGLPPLPEEDVSRMFKIPLEPSRLESLLLLGQVEGLSKNLERESGETLVKTYAARTSAV